MVMTSTNPWGSGERGRGKNRSYWLPQATVPKAVYNPLNLNHVLDSD